MPKPLASAVPANLADLVGGTPLVRFTRVAPDCGAELIGKLEAYNPAGSVKDRIGVSMIEAAEADGRIEPGRTTIVEATSGNTGIALAFVCAAKRYDLILAMPQGMSRERESLLRLYGAEVHVTESLGGMNEAVDAAAELAAERGDSFIPDQFSNPANPEIHRRTTAEEIWRDTGGARSGTRTCTWWRSSRAPRRCSRAAGPARTRSRGSERASFPRCSTSP